MAGWGKTKKEVRVHPSIDKYTSVFYNGGNLKTEVDKEERLYANEGLGDLGSYLRKGGKVGIRTSIDDSGIYAIYHRDGLTPTASSQSYGWSRAVCPSAFENVLLYSERATRNSREAYYNKRRLVSIKAKEDVMTSIWWSKRFIVGGWVFAFLMLFLAYLIGFTSTGLDRDAYNRGEEVRTIGLSYFGKTTFGGGAYPLPEALTFRTNDGRALSPDEVVKVINPELNPFIEDGKVYTRSTEWSEWGEKIYWAPANPVTTKIAGILRFIRG